MSAANNFLLARDCSILLYNKMCLYIDSLDYGPSGYET